METMIEKITMSKPIEFRYKNVELICIRAGWDYDGDGKISYADAAQVKDLGKAFSNSSKIMSPITVESFNELRFFTGLIEIGDFTFRECKQLKSLSIPDSVIRIGKAAFMGCSQLSLVSFSSKLEEIDALAFSGCKALQSILLPNTLKAIGKSAFCGCANIEAVILGNPSTTILVEEYAFAGCRKLSSINISESLLADYIERHVFSGGMEMRYLGQVPVEKNYKLKFQSPTKKDRYEYEDYSRDDLEDMYRDAMGGDVSNEWNID